MSRRTPSTKKRRRSPRRRGASKYWSGEVTRNSHALDLEPAVFKMRSPRQVAASLKRSAKASRNRKASAFQSAMSMLNFYINRAGHGLSPSRKAVLERAKPELRKAFGHA